MWHHHGEAAELWPGRNYPLGASWGEEATNFAVYAPQATGVWLCVFDDDDRERRFPLTEQSLGVWHGAVPGVAPGTRYGYRVDGPWDPRKGLRFNLAKLLLDPYAHAVSGTFTPDPTTYDYQLDAPDERNDEDSAPYVPRGKA